MRKVFEIKAIRTQQFTTRILADNKKQADDMAIEEIEQAEEQWFIFTGMRIDVKEIQGI